MKLDIDTVNRNKNLTTTLPGICQEHLSPYDEFGHILKVSLPTDFSLAVITGFAPGTTPEALVDAIRGLDFDVNIDSIHILGHAASSETKATVRVEDPLFAKELSIRLKSQGSDLNAEPIPIDARRTNCRKVYISWHKATRNVWLNFGNGEIANRVAQKFNDGRYKCLGRSVTSSTAKRSPSYRSRGGFSHNPVAWTIILSGVPKDATWKDLEAAIVWSQDKPRHIEMGSITYEASDAEVSVDIRSLLEERGCLENFYLAPASKGKRVKVAAWFQSEVDARSACTFDGRSLPILQGGKLTVTLVQSAKIKIPMTIYTASKSLIDKARMMWGEQHLASHVYSDVLRRFITIKVEGDSAKDVSNARKTLDQIAIGVTLAVDGSPVWIPAFHHIRSPYNKLISIERELQVRILRDKSRRQLQFYGPSEKFQQAVRQVTDLLRAESSTSYEIDLKPDQFSRMIQGSFKDVERALGNDIAVFNVVSRRIIVDGTAHQYATTLAIIDGKRAIEGNHFSDEPCMLGRDCPICLCEADTPLQTSCKHTYCLECFEECCKSAASTSKEQFQIKCQGDGGSCAAVFRLRELKDHLSSLTFEKVLKSSFEEYIHRHTEAFRYCPTPDCGFIYRCTADHGSRSLAYTCPNCFEPICTSCNARHGGYSCIEYKDIASGGRKALERLKRELNIKDCPRCTTPMEKTEGCNHMTCGGCKSHICWVCMAVFETSGPCYDHMNKKHGGIGLEFDI